MKYQVIEVVDSNGFFGAWAVCNIRTNKNVKVFEGDDEGDNKNKAMDYVQTLIEDERHPNY